MLTVSVMVEVLPEYAEEYEKAVLQQADNCKTNEPGCLRFDVFKSADSPYLYHFQETYTDEKALEFHRTTPYIAEYRAKTKDMTKSKEITYWKQISSA